jgi:hypothetical protein
VTGRRIATVRAVRATRVVARVSAWEGSAATARAMLRRSAAARVFAAGEPVLIRSPPTRPVMMGTRAPATTGATRRERARARPRRATVRRASATRTRAPATPPRVRASTLPSPRRRPAMTGTRAPATTSATAAGRARVRSRRATPRRASVTRTWAPATPPRVRAAMPPGPRRRIATTGMHARSSTSATAVGLAWVRPPRCATARRASAIRTRAPATPLGSVRLPRQARDGGLQRRECMHARRQVQRRWDLRGFVPQDVQYPDGPVLREHGHLRHFLGVVQLSSQAHDGDLRRQPALHPDRQV